MKGEHLIERVRSVGYVLYMGAWALVECVDNALAELPDEPVTYVPRELGYTVEAPVATEAELAA